MTVAVQNLTPVKKNYEVRLSLFVDANLREEIDGRIQTMYCVICGYQHKRERETTCRGSCEDMFRKLLEPPVQLSPGVLNVIGNYINKPLSADLDVDSPTRTETLLDLDQIQLKEKSEEASVARKNERTSLFGEPVESLKKTLSSKEFLLRAMRSTDFPIFISLFTEQNPRKTIDGMSYRKFCIICAKEIDRKEGSFDQLTKDNRASYGSPTAVVCGDSCIQKILSLTNNPPFILSRKVEKEIFD